MNDGLSELKELLHGGGEPLQGFTKDLGGAEREAIKAFPHKPYCVVRDWRIIEVEVDDDYRASLADDGLSPHVLYAAHVMLHSSGKRQGGDWVRSTFQRSLTNGYLFESVNSIYVLMGPGVLKKGSGRAVLSIAR